MCHLLRSTAAAAATAAAALTVHRKASSQQQRPLLSSNEHKSTGSSAVSASDSSSSSDSSTSRLLTQGAVAVGAGHSSSDSNSDSSSSDNVIEEPRLVDSSVLKLHEEFDDTCDTYYDDGYVGSDGDARMHDRMVAIGIPHSVEPSMSGVMPLINGSADSQLVQKLQRLAGPNNQVCYYCHYYNLLHSMALLLVYIT
jgi:hypothetical protein